jgi:flagella basal body P-ring formation protein FlgA
VGKLQQLALTDLAYELQQYPDMEKVTLRGNTELRLQRQSRALTQEELSRAVRGYVESDERWRGERAEIALQKNMHEVQVPLGKSEIQAVGDEEGEGDGDYLIKAHVVVDGSVATEIRIPAKILIMKEVWTAARPIARGRILTAEDLVVRLRPIQSDHGKLIVSTDDVRGMEVDRQIKIDQPILRHCLREPVCAQRGDTVQVMGRRNNLEVAVQAKALSGGRRGDRIMCVNESSKRQFLACLVGPREATLAQ